MCNTNLIAQGKTVLGIEFGSTRIKAVLTSFDCKILATGIYDWENQFENGFWTYSNEQILQGLQGCYADLRNNVSAQYGTDLTCFASMGISAMMHGYLAFDAQGKLLVPFRTWRNTTTAQAACELTDALHYNIPQRWSIAHLHQAMLNNEPHLKNVHFVTTLAGYIHWLLTGEQVLGAGDASGMFPVDPTTQNFDTALLQKFETRNTKYPWHIQELLPKVLVAGDAAGMLTTDGARLLDISGTLQAGVPLCPPEGDAGTGMVATNSVKVKTGNVSAGTSIFAMVVLEKPLENVHPEIDLVTTPSGDLVAMVHCNNCTSDLNAWVNLFAQALESAGVTMDRNELFKMLYHKALEGANDCGGLTAYNYFSGEPISNLEEGRPLFVRGVNSDFTLANFMRAHLYSAVATLKIGMDILLKEENISLEKIIGHGGLFKTKLVGQKVMADALNTTVSVMETASEGGAWGIAVLANYLISKENDQTLSDYLTQHVFNDITETSIDPSAEGVTGFDKFLQRYISGLPVEQVAVKTL